MKRQLKRLPIALFSIPFVYLSLLLDAYYQSIFSFLFSLLLHRPAWFYFKASNPTASLADWQHRQHAPFLISAISTSRVDVFLSTV